MFGRNRIDFYPFDKAQNPEFVCCSNKRNSGKYFDKMGSNVSDTLRELSNAHVNMLLGVACS